MRSRIPIEGNTRSPAGKWNGVHHSESATPETSRSAPVAMPPDKTKATAGNGGESQDIKASDLLQSSLPDGPDFCRDQLTRIETILDCILRGLAPLAGAR